MDTFKPKYEEAEILEVCVSESEIGMLRKKQKAQQKPRGHSSIKGKLKQLEESRRYV